jgi:hypothetical protein
MEPNAFIGRPKQPTDEELTAALGRARAVWDALLDRLAKDCNVVTQEWNCYSRKYGWSLRLKVKDRNILYLAPCVGCFHMAIILGDKAIVTARQGKPSKSVLNLIKEGKKYPEGTAVRIEPVGAKNIPTIVSLAKLKLAH